MQFSEGELVLCYHGPLLYEAKILKTFLLQNEERYFIHYSGWNKNWDEWVGENRILKINPENIKRQKELKSSIATKCKTKKEKQAVHFSKLRGIKPEHGIDVQSSPDGKLLSENNQANLNLSTDGTEPFDSFHTLDSSNTIKPITNNSNLSNQQTFSKTLGTSSFAARYLAKKKNFKVTTNSSKLVKKASKSHLNISQSSTTIHPKKTNRPGVKGMKKRFKITPKLQTDESINGSDGFNQDKRAWKHGTDSRKKYSGLLFEPHQPSPSYPSKAPCNVEIPYPPQQDHYSDLMEDVPHLSYVRLHIPDPFKPLLLDDWDYVTRQQMLILLPAEKSIETIFEEYLGSRKSLDWPTSKMFLAEEFVTAIKKYFDCTIGSQLLYSFERPQYADILEQHSGESLCRVYGAIHLLRLFVNLFENLTQFQLAEPQVTFLVTYLKDFFSYFNENLKNYINESQYETAAPEYYRKII